MNIGPGGEIEYSVKLSTTVICQMSLENFPMDRQTCSLSFYSLGFDGTELCLSWLANPNLFTSHSIDGLPNFYLEHYTNRVMNMTDCADDRCSYKLFLTVEFEFKRLFMSVFFTSYLPAIIMVVLGGLGTFIDPKSSPARITLGITTILTISTIIQGIQNWLPKVSYIA